eukprot:TRINITY_DN2818_c0_g1_i1.p1 TRINITY_DN2818_c0_g1~~TRINITY_DN2818_c0_g1_i1.p1  ORF type:complete len:934 (+),score=166.29 TRINITY_DN2818_c0_g1_i1:3-2804(+)
MDNQKTSPDGETTRHKWKHETESRIQNLEKILSHLQSQLEEERAIRSSLQSTLNDHSLLTSSHSPRRENSSGLLSPAKKKAKKRSLAKKSKKLSSESLRVVWSEEGNRDRCDGVLEWLIMRGLNFFLPLLYPDDYNVESVYTGLFEACDDSFVELVQFKSEHIFWLLLRSHDDPIYQIWKENDFRRRFIYSFQKFMSIDELLEPMKLIIISENNTSLYEEKNKLVSELILDIVSNLYNDMTNLNSFYTSIIYFCQNLSSYARIQARIMNEINSPLISARSNEFNFEQFDVREKLFLENSIIRFSDLELAKEICFQEQFLLSRIPTKAFLGEELCREKTVYIDNYNKMSLWVITEILLRDTADNQASVIQFFCSTTIILYKINNYAGVMQILGGLHNIAIQKLKDAWDFVPKKIREDLADIADVMSANNKYKKYRKKLKNTDATLPCIPDMVCTLHLVNVVDEVMPDKNKKGYINWAKFDHIGKFVSEFLRFKARYPFRSNLQIREYMDNIALFEDEDINYEIACIKDSFSQVPFLNNFSPRLSYNSTRSVKEPRFTDKEIQLLVGGSETVGFVEGDIIFSPENDMKYLYFVRNGNLELKTSNNYVRVIENDDLIGLGSLLETPMRPTFTVEVVEATALQRISPEYLKATVVTEIDLFSKLSRLYAIRGALEFHSVVSTRKVKTFQGSSSNIGVETLSHKMGVREEVILKQFHCTMKHKSSSMEGTMTISRSYICFTSQTLVKKKRVAISLWLIVDITMEEDSITIHQSDDCHIFSKCDNINLVYQFLLQFWGTVSVKETLDSSETEMQWSLTTDDWKKIFASSKTVEFAKGQKVFSKGILHPRFLLVIEKGSCWFQMKKKGKKFMMGEKEILGSLEFMLDGPAIVDVFCAEDSVIRVVEGYYLDFLFKYYPVVESRFYYAIGSSFMRKIIEAC